jgi:hypothetical protein
VNCVHGVMLCYVISTAGALLTYGHLSFIWLTISGVFVPPSTFRAGGCLLIRQRDLAGWSDSDQLSLPFQAGQQARLRCKVAGRGSTAHNPILIDWCVREMNIRGFSAAFVV